MKIGIPKEIIEFESRISITPKNVDKLKKKGFNVIIEKGAGQPAGYSDEDFKHSGALLVENSFEIYSNCDIVFKVLAPTMDEVSLMKENLILICYLNPSVNFSLLESLAARKVNSFAMDAIPRISRAQKMDVLSSMANVAGYRAVIEATYHYGRFLNGQMTAAGRIEPAKVLVIGAGVAGLAAIGTANSLGAIVSAFDTRKEVAEQIESMGASFLTIELNEDGASASGYSKEMSKEYIDAEMLLFLECAKEVDIIITTAQIPNKPAPQLILDYHVAAMKPGSVIVDLAASTGGNCVLTKNREVYTTDNGVTIVGSVSQLSNLASELYSNNICSLLDEFGSVDSWNIDMSDVIISRAMVTYQGKINWPPAPLEVSPSSGSKKAEITTENKNKVVAEVKKNSVKNYLNIVFTGILLLVVGMFAPPEFVQHFTVFVLSIFVGWQVINNVTSALHTPLMSITNAISGIIVVGGILQIKTEFSNSITILACVAILISSINIVGGFVVTKRMLEMFKK